VPFLNCRVFQYLFLIFRNKFTFKFFVDYMSYEAGREAILYCRASKWHKFK